MAFRAARPLLEDMRAYAEEALGYVGDRGADEMAKDRMRYLAIARAAEIVGEAASQVPVSVRDRLRSIPFKGAIGMRNRLIHGYGGIDPTILADTVRNDFPPLVEALATVLAGDLPDGS
jgi:uncharacterized protein with HEPN domain